MRHETTRRHAAPDPLERGGFSDGRRYFKVRASSAEAPDSFQVYSGANRADIVVVVSGLASGSLRATWGDGWRTASEEWKTWVKEQGFKVFYNGGSGEARPVRVCNG